MELSSPSSATYKIYSDNQLRLALSSAINLDGPAWTISLRWGSDGRVATIRLLAIARRTLGLLLLLLLLLVKSRRWIAGGLLGVYWRRRYRRVRAAPHGRRSAELARSIVRIRRRALVIHSRRGSTTTGRLLSWSRERGLRSVWIWRRRRGQRCAVRVY
jgi:hypothetical protein